MEGRGRRSSGRRKPAADGMVDWSKLGVSDSEDKNSRPRRNGRRKKVNDEDVEMPDYSDNSSDEPTQAVESSADDEEEANSESDGPRSGRRSTRLMGVKRKNYLQTDLDLEDPVRPKRGRPSLKPTRGRGGRHRGRSSSSPEPAIATRRSERTLVKPIKSMRERQEDEISSHSEDDTGTKVVSLKEYFIPLDESDPFRRRHRNECDVCELRGDQPTKGTLVFCQGCTAAFHKLCLGFRGTRDHMVTKIGESNFVLQCRRCIGTHHEKDPIAPHGGHCDACQEPGTNSQPFRARLTTKQEQTQREENGGRDPITIIDTELINNPANILFRCYHCQRAWHMHHLSNRKTINSTDDDDETEKEMTEEELAEKRFQLYHRGARCKDCIENKSAIDVLVAWRPTNLETYVPGYHADAVQESQKEYLVKWRNQSYLRVTWMPGSWVYGVAVIAMRAAFNKKPENYLPRMTTEDAVPEEFLRVDIVFEVRYSSVVRNSTMEVDFARVREVESAMVKYKGLGFEDAIWEEPPSYRDTERWNDFKQAYDDYVLKLHTTIPIRGTLTRQLLATRQKDFEKVLMRKIQPTNMTGGQIMQYQLDGLNWLYYQWFKNQNAILADEMGLGKTIQIIALCALLVQEHKCWPFLVVVPNSTCPNWRREIQKWVPSLRVVCYYGSAHARKIIRTHELFPDAEKQNKKNGDISAHIVVTSYESIVEESVKNSLKNVPWQGLFVDEGQRLKNDKNQMYDVLSKFRFPFKVLLTGTPLQNNVRELFNLLQFLDKSINAAEMEAKYAELTQDNVPELHEQLRKFFLRRTKAQVLTFLPPMAQIIVPISMSPLQKKVYKSILAKDARLMKSICNRETAGSKDRINLNNILMQLRKTLCHPFVYSRTIEERVYDPQLAHKHLVEASSKLSLLSVMLPKLKDRGHRVLLFSQFLDNLDIMEDFLDGLGLMHRRLDGGTSSLDKQKKIDEFNEPNSPYFAFLLSTRAGGVGINLATADTVIILDPDFNPHQDIQALSRAHRIGQKNKVLVIQLMTKGSAEEKIMQIGKKKMALDHALIESMDQEDDAGVDLESILRHGAEALFNEDEGGEDEITYDDTSIDRLLDRTQIEATKADDEKSAESQFSFARVWANKKMTFEENIGEDTEATNTPNSGIWDKILADRERAHEEEMARKAETFGRGKRKRHVSYLHFDANFFSPEQNVDYGHDADGDAITTPPKGKGKGREMSDTDFDNRTDQEAEVTEEDESEVEIKRPTVRGKKGRARPRASILTSPQHANSPGPKSQQVRPPTTGTPT
jgi:chromodomain-helicase-DNA-binding protein 4